MVTFDANLVRRDVPIALIGEVLDSVATTSPAPVSGRWSTRSKLAVRKKNFLTAEQEKTHIRQRRADVGPQR
jgi:hypothetical protein